MVKFYKRRKRNVGLLNQKETTNQVLKNGWLHTGDIGILEMDF